MSSGNPRLMKSKNKDWLGVEKCIKIGAKGFSFSFPIENMMLQLYKFVRESCSLVMVPSKNLSHPVFHILLSTSLNILKSVQHERAYYYCSKDQGPKTFMLNQQQLNTVNQRKSVKILSHISIRWHSVSENWRRKVLAREALDTHVVVLRDPLNIPTSDISCQRHWQRVCWVGESHCVGVCESRKLLPSHSRTVAMNDEAQPVNLL